MEALEYLRVAAVVPSVKVGQPGNNARQIASLVREAAGQGAALVVTPELSLTGYTLGDLVAQDHLLKEACAALSGLAPASRDCTIIVGLPMRVGDGLYNIAAVLAGGRIVGLVPKTYLPNYGEFYEQRWYTSGRDLRVQQVEIGGQMVPIGTDLLFQLGEEAVLGIEVCEDLWAPIPPSSYLAVAGATIIANLSASNELAGKAGYRRDLVLQQSARLHAAYVYASCGGGESSTDLVFGGHSMIAENGALLAENERFESGPVVLTADVDLQHLSHDRMRSNTFESRAAVPVRMVTAAVKAPAPVRVRRAVDPHPFVPSDPATLDARAEEIFRIQAAGLATRLRNTGFDRMVIGLSGGLDSTLALLVAVRAARELGLGTDAIRAVTMPGFATSLRTRSNAGRLAGALGVALEEAPITKGSHQLFADIGHDGKEQDVVYENVQARYRTLILLSRANQEHALVLGTGDFSEIALGWATFNGDHISHYNVNAGIPKTLVRHLVRWVAVQPGFEEARAVLSDILDTPVSPELKDEQVTEDVIGPYELHDFFLYHFLRWGSRPQKIQELAVLAFGDTYSREEVTKWLRLFLVRFFRNQWKRSVMADGPKVGSVALSPRGDWRMPSDASGEEWLSDLDE